MSEPSAPLRPRLLSLQHEVLELVATGQSLDAAMMHLCRRVEEIAPPVISSILLVDQRGALHPLAAPSLPDSYSNALEGLRIGPKTGSCGTAAFRGEPVDVADIETDPLWEDYRALALPIGLRACWSSPIKARDGRVIGTFAFYHRTPHAACDADREIADTCVHLCAIAIEQDLARSQIRRIAYYDAVTGLRNRVSFQEQATRLIEEAAARGTALAIHYVDLDDFKGVNDTLGHRTGDLVLKAVADRLAGLIGDEALVARLGGDEFAILQTGGGMAESEHLARRIQSVFDEPFVIEDHRIQMGMSAGIARLPIDGDNLTDLMKNADLALYRAKGDGRRQFRFYAPEMSDAMRKRRATERGLRKAVEAGEFSLLYQPIVNLASGAIVGCEALLRWRHPTRGMVFPSEFIALAEDMGLIGEIGDWALREACRQATEWPERIVVAINLSPLQLRNPDFVHDVAGVLADNALAASRLELEITETVILADNAVTRGALRRLKDIGVGFALDDFGTGYSSLQSLRAFPIDRIKIDKTFVDELGETTHSTSIVRTVIALAADLGMATTAEGIETSDQYRKLLAGGCSEGQGYYFSRPKSGTDVAQMLAANQSFGPDIGWRPETAAAG
jgi:diguanylate cyclase (GGDEF)-like protein